MNHWPVMPHNLLLIPAQISKFEDTLEGDIYTLDGLVHGFLLAT